MKYKIMSVSLLVMLFLTACTADECPEGSVTYVENAGFFPAGTEGSPQNTELRIGNRTILFDQVIHRPLCNNSVEGTVNAACDVQVVKWKNKPTFLDGCNFQMAEDKVIYVAAHNNAPYYKCTNVELRTYPE